MNLPSHQIFLQCLDSAFQVHGAHASDIVLLLQSVSAVLDSPVSTLAHPRQHFSIIFVCESEILLPQQIYTLDHPITGKFELFIVPVGRDRVSHNMSYQAIFS